MSLLEKKIPEFFEEQQAQMARGERPNAALKKLWQECMRRKGEIEFKCGNGEISETQYADLQKN